MPMNDDHVTQTTDWSDEDDKTLIFYGRCLSTGLRDTDGYDLVAQHDLGRAPGEGASRITWLRERRPLLVKQLTMEADREPEL